jgi:hypothetical protein
MKIEEVLHLFTKVGEGLPRRGLHVLAIDMEGKLADVVDSAGFRRVFYTHWLDISVLTTKEAAIAFAETAASKAYSDAVEEHVHGYANEETAEQWIINNKHNL